MLNKNFTRRHLSDKIYQNLGFAKNFSSVIIDNFFEFFLLELEKSNNIKISSFGTFKVSQKKERIGRNPKTKNVAIITSREVVKFKPSLIFKEKINNQ